MATIKVELPTEIEQRIDRLGKETDRIVISCLNAAAVPMKRAVLEEYDRSVGKEHVVRYGNKRYIYGQRSTGDLRSAIGATRPRVNHKGDYDVKIGVAGDVPGSKISNGRLLALLESGARSRNQKGVHFLRRAKKASIDAATAAFIKKFDEEVGNIL